LSTKVASDCHISAYFNDETKVEMLNQYTSNIECNSSKTAEILVRSMQDPGSSRLQEEMMSTLHGHTQFSTQIPATVESMQFQSLFLNFKSQHDATLLAVAKDRIGKQLVLNPPSDYQVQPGDILHYVAPERIIAEEVNWASCKST
jgi:voltage-gated potassium channel